MKKVILLLVGISMAFAANATNFYIPDGDVNALRLAITTANDNNAADTIHLFPYSVYKLTTVDNVFIGEANALPVIQVDHFNTTNSLTILGNGARLVLDTSLLDEVRILFAQGTVTINDLAFIDGRADYDDANGGAINHGGGTLNLYGCLFKGNRAFQGGAVYMSSGALTIDNCTFDQNDAMFLGGAICNLSTNVYIRTSVIVKNKSTNTSVPGAIYDYSALNSPSATNVNLYGSIVALNTYEHPSSPNNGLEFDLASNAAIYTSGNNFIGTYDNANPGIIFPPFFSCLPCNSGDYVGTPAANIDPLLGPFGRHGEYQPSYALQAASLALINHAGLFSNTLPAIASYGLFPATGKESDVITLYGKNLSNVYRVDFEDASVTTGLTVSDTSVRVTVPPGSATGKISVYDYNNFKVTSPQVFTIKTSDPDPEPDPDPDPVTGIGNRTTEFSIYPNPAYTELFVESGGKTFEIIDPVGRVLLTSNLRTTDLRTFHEGLYLIRCGNTVKRFVKK